MSTPTVALTTTGTSLLSNTNNWLKRKYKNLVEIPEKEIKDFIAFHKKQNTETRISAEINATLQLNVLFQKQGRKIDIVHLILSDTEETKKEMPILKKFFAEKGFKVEVTVVEGLKYKESQFKMAGLRSLINRLTELIDSYKARGFCVIMNATGGFKAEIAYATVLAQLRHIESYYIYESFQEIVPLPYLPLNLDIEYWQKWLKYFEFYEKGVDTKTSDEYLEFLPPGFRFLVEFSETDKKWHLNPAGETFYLSLLSEKEVYLKHIDEKNVFKKRKETTLWEKAKNIYVVTLKDIPDREVKQLLRRVLRFQFVNKIELVDYHKVGVSQRETCLEYRTKHEDSIPHYVQYAIKCKDGIQNINIWVEKGFCDELIQMIGKKGLSLGRRRHINASAL
jgi:putative CRISPR-associated protein (TIGR02619 family)